MSRQRIYLASPLGFSPETLPYLQRIKACLTTLGFDLFDPWDQSQCTVAIQEAFAIADFEARAAAFRRIAAGIGRLNEEGIRGSDILLAVLDGAEVDSGTASEVGFAAALGKRCYGLRTDLRDCGDFVGVPLNLQVLHFIEGSGGQLFRSIEEIQISA
jgi:nucleoside 2-deoxyribosyltransferase